MATLVVPLALYGLVFSALVSSAPFGLLAALVLPPTSFALLTTLLCLLAIGLLAALFVALTSLSLLTTLVFLFAALFPAFTLSIFAPPTIAIGLAIVPPLAMRVVPVISKIEPPPVSVVAVAVLVIVATEGAAEVENTANVVVGVAPAR